MARLPAAVCGEICSAVRPECSSSLVESVEYLLDVLLAGSYLIFREVRGRL